MKDQLQEYTALVKGFMKKHYVLFLSLKVLKLLIVFFMFSCESKPEPSKIPDTIMIDTIQGNTPEDSVIYKNDEEETEDGEEENENPLVPQES